MFKGIGRLGMDAFSFSFSGGRVTGPNYSFDLGGIVGGLNAAQKDFFCSNPGQLVSYIHDDWNKKFNSQCCEADCDKSLGVQWNTMCLMNSGTPNLLSAATSGIQNDVASWGKSVLSCSAPSTPPSLTTVPSGGGGSGGGAPVITPGGPPIPQSSAPPDFFGGLGTIGIIAAIAVVGLLMLKR